MRARIVIFLSIFIMLFPAVASPAAERESDIESLRARVEAIASGSEPRVRGSTIAATRLLPRFYSS